MNFVGSGRTLSGDVFARATKTIGCDVAAIRAITEVEAHGQGFDAKRRPIVLFEPHVFYRCLPTGKRAAAMTRGLAVDSAETAEAAMSAAIIDWASVTAFQ